MIKLNTCVLCLVLFTGQFAYAEALEFMEVERVERIAFGSCANEGKQQAIWDAVLESEPDVFVFLGDNIYGDTRNPDILKQKYSELAAQQGFQRLRKTSRVVATWDDHDYGENDAGSEYPIKNQSRHIMLDFWQEPKNSPRRQQEGGIYTSYYFGSEGERIQLLLLDLRWNRTPLKKVGALEYVKRKANDQGPYTSQNDKDAVFLGEAQWAWLEKELQKPAQIRIIASSLQLLAEGTGWEAWSNFPAERERFFSLIHKHQVEGMFVISGDTHWTEISKMESGLPYPLYDITSSGLTEVWHAISPNANRVSQAYAIANYGLIEINWDSSPVKIRISTRDKNQNILVEREIDLPTLSLPPRNT